MEAGSTAELATPSGHGLFDLLPVVVVGVMVVIGTRHMEAVAPSDRPIDALASWMAVGAAMSLGAWRRMPWLTWAVAGAAACAYTARAYPGGPIYLTAAFATFAVAVTLTRVRGYQLAVLLGSTLFLTSVVARHTVAWNDLLFFVFPATAVLVADALRGRRERQLGAEERARFAVAEIEADLDRRRVEERLDLARELHDLVAHSMATINVQAGAAAHVVDRDPTKVKPALEAIRTASGEVLDELRTMLEVLRDGDGVPRRPGLDLRHLDGLVASSRLSGVHVVVRTHGELDGIGADVHAAGFRIVQEALTNVARHSGASRATVTIERGPGRLLVEVVDDGPGAPESVAHGNGRSGLGLVGIGERAAATGGRAVTGRRAEGGFGVLVEWDLPS